MKGPKKRSKPFAFNGQRPNPNPNPNTKAPLLDDELFVLLRTHRCIKFAFVFELDFDHPALAVAIKVDQFRFLNKLFVDLGNLARDRHKQVGDRLDRLDHTKFLFYFELVANPGKLDIGYITELIGSKRRNPDGRYITINLDVLVGFYVLQFLWIASIVSPSGITLERECKFT